MATLLEIESTIYTSVARRMVEIWRTRAAELGQDDDVTAGIAGGLRKCAEQLEGLCAMVDQQTTEKLQARGESPDAEFIP
jgi:hypothetical protein